MSNEDQSNHEFSNYLNAKYAEPLDLSSEDIDELVEDLKEWGIEDSQKFEEHILLASNYFEGIKDHASNLYAALYGEDQSKKHYESLTYIDYEDYLFFFHGDL